jgi:diguanylate cyclase (GGDEF)-like protein
MYSKNDNALIRSAYFNPISELPNRTNIELVIGEQIDRARRHEQTFLLTVVKIINYNEVEKKFKPLVDEFIFEASNRLLSSIRDEDIIGHIADDSFIIVFNEYLNEKNYEIIINRIKKNFVDKFQDKIDYSISIGHTRYENDGSDAEVLIEHAMHNANH